MNATRVLTLAAIMVVCLIGVLALSSEAKAYGSHYSVYGGPGYQYGYYGSYRSFPLHPYHTPYFAYHPPVYYSGVVKRTYGTSPFPQPPIYRSQVALSGEPYGFANPYVTGGCASEVSYEVTKPQVIYPIEMDE